MKCKCKYCNKIKDVKLFTKKSKKLCKQCDAKFSKARRRSKRGLSASIFTHQKASSIKRNHPFPTYNREELYEWLMSQKKFHILYDNWVKMNYDIKLTPSCDRDDCLLPYSFSNLTLMTWGENHTKATEEIKSGKVGAKSRMVRQLTLDDIEVEIFRSIRDVERKYGYDNGFIGAVCKGKYLQAYGFKWEYYDEK